MLSAQPRLISGPMLGPVELRHAKLWVEVSPEVKTVSPLTSGTHSFAGAEINNPYRVPGIGPKQNYAKFSFSGKKNERKLTVEFYGVKGEKLGEWSVSEKELKAPW